MIPNPYGEREDRRVEKQQRVGRQSSRNQKVSGCARLQGASTALQPWRADRDRLLEQQPVLPVRSELPRNTINYSTLINIASAAAHWKP